MPINQGIGRRIPSINKRGGRNSVIIRPFWPFFASTLRRDRQGAALGTAIGRGAEIVSALCAQADALTLSADRGCPKLLEQPSEWQDQRQCQPQRERDIEQIKVL
jgi:hypothetical protein